MTKKISKQTLPVMIRKYLNEFSDDLLSMAEMRGSAPFRKHLKGMKVRVRFEVRVIKEKN